MQTSIHKEFLMLRKSERLDLFYKALIDEPRSSCPQESRDTAARVLKQIEDEHVPDGEKKMTVPEFGHIYNVAYGIGGLYIPLLDGEIHINANGATGYRDLKKCRSTYQLTLEAKDGTPFEPIPDFRYPNLS